MAPLSISTAWSEGSQFAAREFRLLFPIAFLLIGLPAVLANLFIPPQNSPEFYEFALWVNRNGVGLLILLSLAVTLVQMLLNTFGSLAITYLALRPGSSVGESLGAAGRRLPVVFAAVILIALAAVVVMFPLGYLLGGTIAPATALTPGQAVGAFLMLIVMGLLALALGAKLLPLTSIGAAETGGPIAIIARAWRLTNGHFWKLFGTLLLIALVYMLFLLAIGLVFGLLLMASVGNPQVSSTAAFILSLAGAIFGSVIATLMLPFFARIYVQLSGRVSEVGDVFR